MKYIFSNNIKKEKATNKAKENVYMYRWLVGNLRLWRVQGTMSRYIVLKVYSLK